MAELSKLNQNSRTTEADTVSNRMLAEFDKSQLSSDAYLTGVMASLRPVSERLTKSINRIKTESTLEVKDEARDGLVRAVNYLVLGFLHHPDEAVKTAAGKVDAVFGRYGLDITNESYARESSLIESLLIDFANPDLQAAIEVLPGLNQLIGNLRGAQTAFEQAKAAYEEEKAQEDSQDSATVIKKEVISLINNKLVVYLRAMAQVDEAKYGVFAGKVEQIIDEINSVVKRRSKKPETPAAV